MASPRFDPEWMLSALADRDVRFILIGGMAAVLHGDVGVTVDIDVVPESSNENLERLADATRTARFVLRGRRQVAAASDG